MGTQFRDEDRYLNKLIDENLTGSAKYKEDGFKLSEELVNILKTTAARDPQTSAFVHLSIARHTVAGSIAKRSHLGPAYKPDYDLVLFLNVPAKFLTNYSSRVDLLPTSEIPSVLKYFVNIIAQITKSSSNKIEYNDDFKEAVTVKFGGYEFDLVPAINFHQSHLPQGAMNVQWVETLKRCYSAGKHLPYMSSSMGEKVIEYVKGQSDFVHRVIILAKLWAKNAAKVDKAKHMCARSTIIELLAVKAAQEEVKHVNPSITKAIQNFLEMVNKPRKELRIRLDSTGVCFPEYARLQLGKVKRGEGMLIDPVNPFFDDLSHENWGVVSGWEELRKAAERSLNDFQRG